MNLKIPLGIVVILTLILLVLSYAGMSKKGSIVQIKAGTILPDIEARPPEQLYMESFGNHKSIRFSTTFINKGKSALELISSSNPITQKTIAKQIIRNSNGIREEHLVGKFILHPTHGHWHIEDYVSFQLWTVNEEGERLDLLKGTDKMSFCIWDKNPYDLSLEGAPRTGYYLSCNRPMQGISVGWSDTYEASTDGQSLDISGVSDGRYLISTTVNPDRKILESDYSNNENTLIIEINGNTLSIPND